MPLGVSGNSRRPQERRLEKHPPYCPTDDDPPSTAIVLPFAAFAPPSSHAEGDTLKMSALLRSPYKPWTAVASPSGIEAASSKEILDGFWWVKSGSRHFYTEPWRLVRPYLRSNLSRYEGKLLERRVVCFEESLVETR